MIEEDDMYQCSACSEWYHERYMLSLSSTRVFDHNFASWFVLLFIYFLVCIVYLTETIHFLVCIYCIFN